MVKKLRLKEDKNNDMYYRLSYIDDTDKLIKDFNRRWEDFKNTSTESFNAHVKNNAQELRDKVWDALNTLIRATKATKLGEAVNENYWDDYQEYLKNPESHPEIAKYVVTPEMWKEEARHTIEYFFKQKGWDTSLPEVQNYIDAVNDHLDMDPDWKEGEYTLFDWYKDTKMNNPEDIEWLDSTIK